MSVGAVIVGNRKAIEADAAANPVQYALAAAR